MKTQTREQIMNCSDFNQLLNAEYGQRGTQTREQFEAEAEAFVLGELLKQERETAGLTQQQLANQSGCTKATIARLEQGRSNVSLSSIFHIFAGMGKKVAITLLSTLLLLTLGVGQMWGGQGYNGESHVYLNVDGTTKYYKVSTESWSTGSSLPGTWGGVLKDQTFNKVLNIQIKGGAVGGWTENGGNISGNLYYKVTNNTTTPSSGWTTVGGINDYYTTKSGNNCFRYKNDYSVNVTPTTPGTYYLHIKITDGASNNRTSYVKIVVPSFTVAGSSAVLGSDWSATDTGNDMTFSSGTSYTLTKSNVTLSTGTTYECKVVLNHDWDAGSYPGSNKTFTVAANGHYNVTFTFNASTKAVDVSTTRLYAVIYNDNGKTSGSVPATSYHANGATVTVASNSGSLAKTGYSFGGWNTNSSGTGTNYTAGSGTFTMGSSDKNLYAKWTENMSTVSFVASPTGKGTFQVNSSTVTSTTAGVTTTRSVTAVPISGYRFTGWSISGGATISSTSTNPTTITGGGAGTAATLTATFEEDLTYFKLKFGARSGETSYGTVAAEDGSGDPLTSNTDYLSGTSVTVTATATDDDYKFDSWYNAWTGGSSVSTTNPLTFTLTAATNRYAHFVQKTTTVTINRNGGSGGSDSFTATHGSTLPSFTMPARSGYTLTGLWTESSGGTKIVNADKTLVASVTDYTTSGKKWDYDDDALTLYAQWTENMTTVTVNVSPAGTGTLTVGGAAFTPGNTTTAGKTTSRTVVATAANDYTFDSWGVTGNATGTSSTNTYTLKGNGSGSTGTLTANFTLIPCKLYKVSAAKNGSTTDKGAMSYDATEHAYYKDITTDASPYYFRFYYNTSAQYCTDWSSKAGGDAYTSGKLIAANGSKETCDQSVGGWGDKPAMYYPGESGTAIRIWFDFQNKKVWITADKDKQYVLRGAFADNPEVPDGMPGWSATTSYFDGLADGNTGTYAATLNASEWYHLKAYDMYNSTWYGPSSDTGLSDGVLSTATAGGGGDFYFQTTIAGSYTFTFDKSSGTKLKVDYPSAYQVTFSAHTISGSNGQSDDPTVTYNSGATSVTSGDYVPNGTSVTFTAAAAKSGYTWNGWYDAATGGTKKSVGSNLSYSETVSGSAITRYARYTQNTHSVTLTNANSTYGTVNTASPVTVGEAEAVQIQATPNTGYMFNGWNLTTGSGITYHVAAGADQITDGSGASKSTTYITTTANATLQATWDEDRSSGYFVHYGNDGKNADGGTDASQTRDWADGNLYKKAGETAGTVSYWTFTAGAADVTKVIEFKVLEGDPEDIEHATAWYGYKAVGGGKIDGSIVNQTLSTSYGNGRMVVVMPGNYIFKWDSSTKQLSITYPTGNYLRGDFNSWGWDHQLTSTGVANEYSCTVSLEAGQTWSAPDHGFKVAVDGVHYGKNSTSITRGSNTASSLSTSGSNIGLTTDVAGSYTFTFNSSSKNLSVTYPTAYTITYGAGTTNGSDAAITVSPSFTSGAYVLPETDVTFSKGNTKDGYTWKGWYSNSNGSGTLHSNTDANYTWSATRTGNISVYACYTLNNYTITYNLNGGSNPVSPAPATAYNVESSTITLPTPTRTGYIFGGWYVNSSLTGDAVTQITTGSYGNKAYWAKWTPITYTIHFNGNGNTSGSMSDQTGVTYDAATTITANAFVKTGYKFAGWATAADGDVVRADGAAHGNLTSTNGATVQLYAKWNAKQSAITFDYQTSATGYASSGSITNASGLKGTYGAAMTTLTGTMPSAQNGYAFTGFYDATSDGTKYYNADGTSAHVWDKDTESGTTLYARWEKAEITGITMSPGTVVENNSTVTVTATVSPTPTGTTTVCWRVLRDNDTPLDPQPAFVPATAIGASVNFTAPDASGWYKVEAVLHTGSDCEGTELSTTTQRFQVAGSHTVTIAYKHSSTTIAASTSVTGRPLDWSEPITAPSIFGYTFDHWTAGDGITLSEDGTSALGKDESTSATIYITATYNGTLTANYTPKNYIYFKDNLEWTDPEDENAHIYVNLLTADYWNDANGTGNEGVTNRNLQMDRVPGTTDIFYYDYGSKPTSNWISFTQESMDGYTHFYQAGTAHVVFPSRALDALGTNNASGFGFYAATPMFVPLATQTPVKLNSNHATYYNDGYWTKYLPGTGYTLEIYNAAGNSKLKEISFTSADELMPMKAVTDLEGGTTYKFQLKRDGNVYYGNNGTMTYADHGQNTAWDFYNNYPFNMCTIVTNAAGDYTFNLSYSPNNGGTENRLRMSVDYPVASGDYRLVYKDNTRSGGKPSAIVAKENDGTAIVSFFVRHNQSPKLYIQQATVDALTGAITWNEYPTSGTPTNQITGTIASAITSGGTDVYNFNLSMNGSGALTVASVEKYTGNYYIRTDAANSKWDNYRTDPDHLMTYSDYLKSGVGYTHYYTHWVNKDETGRKNVKFVIANDYSPCISDTLARETATGTWANIATFMEEGGDLKRSANVRFMWDQETNAIERAYVDGAQEEGTHFLELLSSDSKIQNAEGSETLTAVTFSDKGNWIYEANIQAQPNAQIKLKSTWGEGGTAIVQYFKGTSEATETLIGGSGETWYSIRLLYDFKTNRLVAGYVPSGEIDVHTPINADVMFVREAQENINQLTFGVNGDLSDIKTAYGVLRFNKWTINNKDKSTHSPIELSAFERGLYFISFPFRVNLEEVFGFGTYGTHWIIRYYDGADRAKTGYWADNNKGFWKYITNRKGVFLEPNQGYMLALDLDLLGEGSSVWTNTDQVELYFPSYGTMPDITSSTVTHNLPAHECTINRGTTEGDRRVKDSHWNVMSVPTYVNTSSVSFANTDWTASRPQFLYEWNMNDNTLTARSGVGYTYKAMHAYIVQYYDEVTWTSSVSPASPVAARRNSDVPKDVEFRLELSQNEKMIDQTFVRMSDDEDVSSEFVFGEDLSKEFNKNKANIYSMVTTMIDGDPSVTQTAGNTLPMNSDAITFVPLGVKIANAGEYTFAMPAGTSGVGVKLYDNLTSISTDLSAGFTYTTDLDAGTHDGRFVLEISPIKQVTTGVEEGSDVSGQNGARKVMIDGILYIVKDNKLFDARGVMVK